MNGTTHRNGNAIEIRGLRKHYEGFDLGPLELTVPRGSIYGFVGPNGAGKSTTIDLMFGMGVADAGSIRINGLDQATDEVAIKKRAAYVGPDLDYGNWGKIGRAIRFVRGFYPETWDDDYCGELLGHFNLGASDKISTLSFGSKTKLAILIALSRRSDVLVLDEPTTGLDAIAKQELFSQLLALVIVLMFPLVQVFQMFDHRMKATVPYLWTAIVILVPLAFCLSARLLNSSYPWRAGVLRMKGMMRG